MGSLEGRRLPWKPLNLGMLLAKDKHAQEYVKSQSQEYPLMTVYDHLLMYLLAKSAPSTSVAKNVDQQKECQSLV